MVSPSAWLIWFRGLALSVETTSWRPVGVSVVEIICKDLEN
jgi:hypothetical protein